MYTINVALVKYGCTTFTLTFISISYDKWISGAHKTAILRRFHVLPDRVVVASRSLRAHMLHKFYTGKHYENINILQFLTAVKKDNFQMKNCDVFCSKHWLWVLVVLTSTHNLCFRAKIRKHVYPCKPQFKYIKVGCKGVYLTRTC